MNHNPTHDSTSDGYALVAPESSDTVIRDIDDLTPNEVLNGMRAVATSYSPSDEDKTVDVPVPVFLRESLREVWKAKGVEGRINVGANRHWPRLWEYLVDLEIEAEHYGARHFRIMNATRGAVAAFPEGPQRVRVRITGSFFG